MDKHNRSRVLQGTLGKATALGHHFAAIAADVRQGDFNDDLNANVNADFRANGMLQMVPTPKIQYQWGAVSTPWEGSRFQCQKKPAILQPKGNHLSRKGLLFQRFNADGRFQCQWHSATKIGIEDALGRPEPAMPRASPGQNQPERAEGPL